MIQIKNLNFSYKKEEIFNNISLDFEPGNIYGLLGENGVGKTTLLKIICGLLKPNEGTCQVDGIDSDKRLPVMLEDMCLVPDEIYIPLDITPQKYMNQVMEFYPNAKYEKFEDLMRQFEVDAEKKLKQMSFGQQKKALMAVYLSLGTKYLFLDEPTNGLDIPSKTVFRSILSNMATEDRTIIISTHQVKDVENLIDPIIILNRNEVLLNATMAKITEKLLFSYDTQMAEGALYSEPRPGGFLNVLENHDGQESQVDIEALFNAVLRNKDVIKEMFNK